MSDTPRTDKEERWAEWNGNEFEVVHVEFARELERELVLAQKELRAARELYSSQYVTACMDSV